MRGFQLPLPIAIPHKQFTPEEFSRFRKKGLIDGRPRRLKYGSAVIKVSIAPHLVPIVDRIREKLEATRPEAIRTAVEMLALRVSEGYMPGVYERTLGVRGRRCQYWKIPLAPWVLEIIGHQDGPNGPTGLCNTMQTTRQGVISFAIEEYINMKVKMNT